MASSACLAELSRLAAGSTTPEEAVDRTLALLEEQLGTRDVFLVYGAERDFDYYSGGAELELSRTAVWLVNRDIVARGAPASFNLVGGRVRDFRPAGQAGDYVAAPIPGARTAAQMLLIRPAGRRITGSQVQCIIAAAPALSLILDRRRDHSQSQDDQLQLSVLASISRIINQTEDLESVLARVAMTIANAAGVNFVSIDLLAPDGTIALRSINDARTDTYQTNAWVKGKNNPDPIRDSVIATGEAVIMSDVQQDPRVPEGGRQFFMRSLIRSTAVFPLAVKDQVLGVISIASMQPTEFDGATRDLIEGLASQVATAVQGIRLYEEVRESHEELSRSEERFRALVQSSSDMIIVFDADGQPTYVSPAVTRTMGYQSGEWSGDDVHPDDAARAAAHIRTVRETPGAHPGCEVRVRHRDGSWRDIEFVGTNLLDDPAIGGIVYNARDVTHRRLAERDQERQSEELRRLNEELTETLSALSDSKRQLEEKSALIEQALEIEREHARRDSLTGVFNHAAVTELLRARLESGDPLAVAMVDVDGMKAVNDTYGHVSGDGVLIAVANALTEEGAIVGRYGGDEFLVVLAGASRAAADAYGERVLARLADVRLNDGDTGSAIPVVVSVGVALYPEEADSIVDLIKLSDSTMYSAKWRRTLERGDLGRGDDRAAKMIGELVPLLTTPGDVQDKLSLVAHRLSADAHYDGVDCRLFDGLFNPPIAHMTAGLLAEGEVGAAWSQSQTGPERRGWIRPILQQTRRPLIIRDVGEESRFDPRDQVLLAAAGLKSALVAPMLWQGELIGTICVVRRQAGAFEPRDAQFLAAVANQVTAIVRMASLVDGLQSASTRLASAHAETVMMLAAAAEAHDRTTGEHLRSIRDLSETLARELGFAPHEVLDLGLAAALHDIGKISVPDTILSSPMRFDVDDWEMKRLWDVMKRHTVWGAEFLNGRPGFELAARVARWHHERWDGGGYPDGLKADAIPGEVAIVSVADTFDAITSDRPYRVGRTADEAIREILTCAGTQFSPDVVGALVRIHRGGGLPVAVHHDLAA